MCDSLIPDDRNDWPIFMFRPAEAIKWSLKEKTQQVYEEMNEISISKEMGINRILAKKGKRCKEKKRKKKKW